MEENKQQTQINRCLNQCDFFGNPNTEGLCSKCYREKMQVEQKKNTLQDSSCLAAINSLKISDAPSLDYKKPEEKQVKIIDVKEGSKLDLNTSNENQEEKTPEKPPQKSNRCPICRTKLGLTAILCECGKSFCGVHRYADRHDCPFDYKVAGKELIRKENPQIIPPKIDKC